jgi:hypothetical protein
MSLHLQHLCEGLLHFAYAHLLGDSGATKSFVSVNFCNAHSRRFKGKPSCLGVADEAPLVVQGDLPLPKGASLDLNSSQSFVADIPGWMSWYVFLARFDPKVSLCKGTLSVGRKGKLVFVQAHQQEFFRCDSGLDS